MGILLYFFKENWYNNSKLKSNVTYSRTYPYCCVMIKFNSWY